MPPPAPLGRLYSAHAQGELDVVRHGHVTEQRVVLEYEADPAFLGGHVGDVAAMERDAAVVYARETGDCPQQRAFAAAARAQQDEEFPVSNVQRYIVDNR